MTLDELKIFNILTEGVGYSIQNRIHRVIAYRAQRHGDDSLRSVECQMEHAKDHWVLRGYRDLTSGLSHEDHAIYRLFLAATKMLVDVESNGK
jgi:hypothetical protein